MNNYSVMEYLYRDANNFKAFGKVLLSGVIHNDELTEIQLLLDSGEFFVAEQVGIPVLYSQLWDYSNGPTISDHAYHEFSGFRFADKDEISSMDLWGDISTLMQRFRSVSSNWDCSQSVHCPSM